MMLFGICFLSLITFSSAQNFSIPWNNTESLIDMVKEMMKNNMTEPLPFNLTKADIEALLQNFTTIPPSKTESTKSGVENGTTTTMTTTAKVLYNMTTTTTAVYAGEDATTSATGPEEKDNLNSSSTTKSTNNSTDLNYPDDNYEDSNQTTSTTKAPQDSKPTNPPKNHDKTYKEDECFYNYTKGGRRAPENHYHCRNRRWIWGMISIFVFFLLIGFCVACCRLCLGICICSAIANKAHQRPRVNPYQQQPIYGNDAIFLPPVPVYTMHTNLGHFPIQSKGYPIRIRPGTF